MNLQNEYRLAAEALIAADAILIGAGAGMGVDSGLPDFRGPEGFWKAYPPFRGRHFSQMSTPHWFETDPQLAWGFFGHRLNLYRSTIPHDGFHILRKWGERAKLGCFVFTSNVDGQFQKAGFSHDGVVECHGSIHHFQCTKPCGDNIWPAGDTQLEIDLATIRTASVLPTCPHCHSISRPNILMFQDRHWIDTRSEDQFSRWQKWLRKTHSSRLVTIELGAGLAIPTVRMECEAQSGTLIRVNPREADLSDGGIALPVGAMEALRAIDQIISRGSR